MNTFGSRFREERRRLGLIQQEIADVTGLSKRAMGTYERGVRSPDAEVLMRLIDLGMDVYYVLTGERVGTRLDLDPMQRSLLDDFERCTPEAQLELVKHAALMAKGVAPTASSTPARKPRAKATAPAKQKKKND
ncbi:helix-turn-helix domain-containing protein [Hydrogenophaga sp. ANAO-22]|uniref:helix-turn-helix domain-containing protein n=1 Tax=Hydrogenophaga sp. ANAO-22 TaxID=3166645 RepID=UPI0036D2D328